MKKSIFEEQKKPLTVSEFISQANNLLMGLGCRVQGELGRVNGRGGYLFFSLKDSRNNNVLNCFAWKSVMDICGVDPKEGMEVIISGISQIYPKNGQLNFQVETIELLGAGALKAAFEKLKNKLEEEGLFRREIKRPLGKFPQNIALITSSKGEALGDFNTNIGQFGFQIKLIDVRVEGQRAVYDILGALKYFKKHKKNFDVLAIIRGGGSWESLQAFNNEKVARAIRECEIPTICGIGHEGDVTIADLVSDWRASTPTAVAKKISENWLEAQEKINNWQNLLKISLEREKENKIKKIATLSWKIESGFSRIFQVFNNSRDKIKNGFDKLGYGRKRYQENLDLFPKIIFSKIIQRNKRLEDSLMKIKQQVRMGSPEYNLKLGYSLAFQAGKIVRSVKTFKVKDNFWLKLGDGELKSEVKKIKNNQ